MELRLRNKSWVLESELGVGLSDCRLKLTNFARHFLRKFLLFFLWGPSPHPALNIAFPLGNGVLRSEEGGGFRKEGDSGEGENRRKKGRAKCAQENLVSKLKSKV